MPCARPSKSSTERPARSGSRAPVPCHAVCTSLSVSGRYEIAYSTRTAACEFETVTDTLEEAKAARAEIVRPRCVFGPSTKTTLEITQIQPFRTEVPHADLDDLGDRRPRITFSTKKSFLTVGDFSSGGGGPYFDR